jgi:hypothetical protein
MSRRALHPPEFVDRLDVQLSGRRRGSDSALSASGPQDARGGTSGLTYDDGLPTGGLQLALQYTPDTLRRLSAVQWSRATPSAPSAPVALRPLVAYTWHGGLRLTRTTTIGSSSTTAATSHTAFGYDPFGRLTRIEDTVTAGTQQPVVSNRFDYAYDAAGNLTKESYGKVGGRRGDWFTYDAYYRLRRHRGTSRPQVRGDTNSGR